MSNPCTQVEQVTMRAALSLAVLLYATTSTSAAPRHPVCVPTYIEGAGTVLICAPIYRRRTSRHS